MKRLFCALCAALCILTGALGEVISTSPSAEIQIVTPTPSAAPLGTVFSGDGLTVTLPLNFEILDTQQRAGYDAAVQADYPDAARILLAASKADNSAALCFSVFETDSDASTAACEAAEKILSSTVTVSDVQYGENCYSSFICAIGEQIYHLFYHSGTQGMLLVSASGLTDDEIETMLTGLSF